MSSCRWMEVVELRVVMGELMQTLSGEELLLLYAVGDGWTVPEAAARLRTSRRTAYRRLQRIRRLLRLALDGRVGGTLRAKP